ncbi:hypothetical protein T439DRAFT_127122 [Meredithblackwellia eburnea MCA 4105]
MRNSSKNQLIQANTGRRSNQSGRLITFNGRRATPSLKLPYKFVKPNFVEDGSSSSTSKASSPRNVGTIQICLYRSRVREDDSARSKKKSKRRERKFNMPQVNEKNKKAMMSHQVSFGQGVAIQKQPDSTSSPTYDLIDRIGAPYWTLEFQYMSRFLLEMKGLIEGI